ncbi:hypothetical protein [Haliangium sp.]|uniref:hypothetical protein n=1 Tax=Haliangium sp. TaxID=2663208 RepID=UPI003D14A1DF
MITLVAGPLPGAPQPASVDPGLAHRPAEAAPEAAGSPADTALAERLERALRAHHHADLHRLGARAGAIALARVLVPGGADPDPDRTGAAGVMREAAFSRAQHLAAIVAAPAALDAWALEPTLAVYGAGPDRLLAAHAAHAAVAIARPLADAAGPHWGGAIDADAVAAAAAAWGAVADDPGRWSDVRVLALETAVTLDQVLVHMAELDPGSGFRTAPSTRANASRLARLQADPDPELRRAGFELAPAPSAAAAAAVAADPDPRVALAAAALVCAEAAEAATTDADADADAESAAEAESAATESARPDRAPIALHEPARVRLRALVLAPDLPVAARVGAARCLRAGQDPADRRALASLPATLPAPARALVSK